MDSTFAYYSAQQQEQEQYSSHTTEQQQFWPQYASNCASTSDSHPHFTNPFNSNEQIQLDIVQPSTQLAFEEAVYGYPLAHQQQTVDAYPNETAYYAPQQPPVFAVPDHTYTYNGTQPQHFAQQQVLTDLYSSPLSDLSALSSVSGSPASLPHLLTPIEQQLDLANALEFVPAPCTSSLMPMPLDPELDAYMPLSAASSSASMMLPSPAPPASSDPLTPTSLQTRTAPSTASTGPALGEFAVLTMTGHTIASSDSYRTVLNAARSARRTAESTGDDAKTCPFCGKVCDRPSTLRTHLNSHTGARPHTCDVPGCNRQFTVLSNMYRHKKACAAQRARDVRRASITRRV